MELAERFAVRHFMPDVEDSGIIDRIFDFDHLGSRFVVATACSLMPDLLPHTPKELFGVGRGCVRALSPRRELNGQTVGDDDSDPRIHDVEANPLCDLELLAVSAVDLDSSIGKCLLNVSNRQRFLQPTHLKNVRFGPGTVPPPAPQAQLVHGSSAMTSVEALIAAGRGSHDRSHRCN